jgi:hypothetical protein
MATPRITQIPLTPLQRRLAEAEDEIRQLRDQVTMLTSALNQAMMFRVPVPQEPLGPLRPQPPFRPGLPFGEWTCEGTQQLNRAQSRTDAAIMFDFPFPS